MAHGLVSAQWAKQGRSLDLELSMHEAEESESAAFAN
jgi:hypothetical protein